MTERPVAVEHEDEVEGDVKDDGEQVGDRQVEQEPVGHRSHVLVGHYRPDDDCVADERRHNQDGKENEPH